MNFLNPTIGCEPTEQELTSTLTQANEAYRSGNPTMSDLEYDQYIDELTQINPNSKFLNTVEPEASSSNSFIHTSPMLSTNKAYSESEILSWLTKVEKAAFELGITNPVIRGTAKLDGVACKYIPLPYSDSAILATRGDGVKGNVIENLLELGLKVVGSTDTEAVGELVMKKAYFEEHLSQTYSHPRNYVAGIVSADNYKDDALQSLANGAVELVLYKNMPAIEMELSDFRNEHNEIEATLRNTPYPIDGVVYEVKNPQIKELMGSSSHHHHWQIAKKQRGLGKETEVIDITYQVGRTGLLTPVVHISPVDLDGAITSKVTAHHVGNVIEKGIGIGAKLRVLRAGQVIPTIESVITPSQELNIPQSCPICTGQVEMRNDKLYCVNDDCEGHSEAKIIHHFKILNALLFGKATVYKIVDAGYTAIEDIYQMTQQDLVSCGLGDGQAANLLREIARIKSEPMPDYLLLASLGVSKLGRGSSKKLLAKHRINEVSSLTVGDLLEVDGFQDTTANIIQNKLDNNQLLAFLLTQGFEIEHTQDVLANAANKTLDLQANSPVQGKLVVFTGTCSLSRTEMSEWAASLGCEVQERVNKQTDYLVCGEKVGNSKMEKAAKLGATVLTEQEFRALSENNNENAANDAMDEMIFEEDVPFEDGEAYNPFVEAQSLAFEKEAVTLEATQTHSEDSVMTATMTATTQTTQDGDLLHLDPNALSIPEWGNPRREMSEDGYLNLLNSVKARKEQGKAPIHTPIFVRPVDGGYQIIAGFTRRAVAIEAQLSSIPCISRNLTDQEAYELAVSENIDRTAMSALDEANALKEIVKRMNGDVQAAAESMGWTRTQFDRALQLLRATEKVRSLVGKKQENGFTLSVTHAARLSVLPEHLQDKLIDGVIKEKMNVATLTATINKAVKRPLANAPFCKQECANCPYNSESIGQTSMFEDENEEANCTNPSCYVNKTNEHRESMLVELEKEYGKIVLLSTVDNPLTLQSSMVGETQFQDGCLSCDKYCAIYADTGLNQGKIIESQCLDAVCASTKQKEYQDSLKPEQGSAEEQPEGGSEQATSEIGAPNKTKATSNKKAQKGTANATASLPKRLIMESQTALREVGTTLLTQHPSYALAVTLSALKRQSDTAHSVETGIVELMKHEPQQLQQMIMDTISTLTHKVQRDSLNMERTVIRASKAHCETFESAAIAAWQPTKDRLEAMTKAIRQQVLEQSGFAKAYKTANDESKYTALLSKKTSDSVADILAFDFDWTHYAPDYYKAAIKDQKYNF